MTDCCISWRTEKFEGQMHEVIKCCRFKGVTNGNRIWVGLMYRLQSHFEDISAVNVCFTFAVFS